MNKSINARFSHSANTYEKHSSLQKSIADYVSAKASLIEDVDSILEIGCGTGFLTDEVVKKCQCNNITALDISQDMIEIAQKRVGKDNITWLQDDLIHLDMKRKFNLIVSSSSLQWIKPLNLAFSNLSAHLEPSGYVVFSMMLNGTFRELREARMAVAPNKKESAPLPSEDDVLNALHLNGFEITEHEREIMITQHDNAETFLRSIHEQGVTGRINSSDLLNRSELAALIKYYNETFRNKINKVSATYDVLYITARKGMKK